MSSVDREDSDELPEGDFMSSLYDMMSQRYSTLADFAGELRPVIRELRGLDPIKMAATVGGLLVQPGLQSSCIRLEMLALLAVRHCQGKKKPNRETMSRLFFAFESTRAGKSEDPAEDVFVDLVSTEKGNYRLFSGVLEGSGYYTQMFLDLLKKMPPGSVFARLRAEVYSLLLLSEAIASRLEIPSYVLGEDARLKRIPNSILGSLSTCRKSVTFSQADLSELGINRSDLRRFAFPQSAREKIDTEVIGHTSLERSPLIMTEDCVIVVMPTVISGAIRRCIIDMCLQLGLQEDLERAISHWYATFFNDLPFLGGKSGAPALFREVGNVTLASFEIRVDAGRWLHVLAFRDDLAGYEDGGLSGRNRNPDELGAAIKNIIDRVSSEVISRPGFKAGMSLVVCCGWGRTIMFADPEVPDRWRVETVSAHDLQTISHIPGMRPLNLWRTLDMADEIKARGLELQNVNGLLNLIASARQMEEHLVPHAQLPSDLLSPSHQAIMVVEQNALRLTRHEVAIAHNRRRLLDIEGRWVPVCHFGYSVFAEDRMRPEFVADKDAANGRLRGAYVTATRSWWIEVSGDGSRQMVYKLWEMLLHWLGEAAPLLERDVPGLPNGPLRWLAHFEGLRDQDRSIPERVADHEIADLIQSAPDSDGRTVICNVAEGYEAAFYRPDNAAERTLVASFIQGTLKLSRSPATANDVERLVRNVVRSPDARHLHMFEARTFRHFVANSLPKEFVEITSQDNAAVRLGLAWRAPGATTSGFVEGKAECMALLNSVVAALESDLCSSIQMFERKALLKRILENHESVSFDSAHWVTTSSAILALRRDRVAALETLSYKESKRSAVTLASRVLIEAAISEAPIEGDQEIGDIDLARLMVIANSIFLNAGWSDAIRWDAMEPRLKLSPLGDILSPSDFEQSVIMPFIQSHSNLRVADAVKDYPKNYEALPTEFDTESAFDPAFLDAWIAEFGFSLDQGRRIVDDLENLGIQRENAVFEIRSSELLAHLTATELPTDVLEHFVSGFTMYPRDGWKVVPPGYRARDIEIWRFRRRLSLLRLPLVAISNAIDEDPELLVAPGLVREAYNYQLRNFHDGNFDKTYATSTLMKSWIGESNNRQGHAFNAAVAERMRELGWKAECDVKITRLLRRGFGVKDWGDVDVLAWNEKSGRVLLMECKDLQFRKTPGEIAEQVAKFRGEIRTDGKPDLLRKHLDRFEIIQQYVNDVKAFVGMEQAPRIECHVVFKDPVPMKYAWDRLAHVVGLHLFDELANL